MNSEAQIALRQLPRVDAMLTLHALAPVPLALRTRLCRQVLADVRARIVDDGLVAAPQLDALAAMVLRRAQPLLQPSLVPVVNATGVLLHTNLGRAPLADAAIDAMAAAAGYTNVEYVLADGRRGGRGAGVHALLALLTGCEAALVVNNCAAAVLLAISSLARGREVLVSRGELVEIGGSFRVPEVMVQGGARLVEVGTTNRTRLADYVDATGPDTAVWLKVHRSNFAMQGFTDEVSAVDLARARDRLGLDVCVIEDQGAATLLPLRDDALLTSLTPFDAVDAGVDMVMFSGDKLLGGPQAGILVGRHAAISRAARHPLFRALRADKTILAGVEATLRLHATDLAREALPLHRMAAATVESLQSRAEHISVLLQSVSGIRAGVASNQATLGGGSLPGETLPSVAVTIERDGGRDPEAIAIAMRNHRPPVVGTIRDRVLYLDLRTVPPADDGVLIAAVRDAASRAANSATEPRGA